jgi:hypothetical protein
MILLIVVNRKNDFGVLRDAWHKENLKRGQAYFSSSKGQNAKQTWKTSGSKREKLKKMGR